MPLRSARRAIALPQRAATARCASSTRKKAMLVTSFVPVQINKEAHNPTWPRQPQRTRNRVSETHGYAIANHHFAAGRPSHNAQCRTRRHSTRWPGPLCASRRHGGASDSGAKIDVTGRAKFTFSEPVADANSPGFVTPTANGHAMLTVAIGDKSAKIDVQVAGLDNPQSPDFIRDMAPIIARAGCNAGTCHGAQAGKNGFKLSLRGYDPVFDVPRPDRRPCLAPRERRLARTKPDAAKADGGRSTHGRPGDQARQCVLRIAPRNGSPPERSSISHQRESPASRSRRRIR